MMKITRTTQVVFVSDVLELVGVNEQVDQWDYSKTVEVVLPLPASSGEIISVTLYSNQGGEIDTPVGPEGAVLFFDTDPELSSGDTALAIADRRGLIGELRVGLGSWLRDTSSGSACIQVKVPVYFGKSGSFFLAWWHSDAQSLNEAAEDDETLEVRVWGHYCPEVEGD